MTDTVRHSSSVTLDRILKAARDAFSEHGFDGAKLDSIAKSASVSKQLVYHYFKTKEELYGVVLDRIAVDVHAMLDTPDYDKLSPPEAIAALIDRIIQNNIDLPFLIGMTVDQALHQGEHVTRRSQYLPAVRKFVEGRIVPILDRGVVTGDFRPGVDPYLFYWSVFALATGSFAQNWSMSETCGVDFSSEQGIALWRDHVVALTLGGLKTAALPA
ncbi:TetR/AcrR family transcriptional regulator [Parasphingorhabdus sp.]|uniref:TetR/AcrR family transcriptional regulator n=1 Tax=Parasphingorhabdus sp. TaxID=2709688 RepID=UPI003A936BD2